MDFAEVDLSDPKWLAWEDEVAFQLHGGVVERPYLTDLRALVDRYAAGGEVNLLHAFKWATNSLLRLGDLSPAELSEALAVLGEVIDRLEHGGDVPFMDSAEEQNMLRTAYITYIDSVLYKGEPANLDCALAMLGRLRSRFAQETAVTDYAQQTIDLVEHLRGRAAIEGTVPIESRP